MLRTTSSSLLSSVAAFALLAAIGAAAQAPIERPTNPHPMPGVGVRTAANSFVRTVASDADHTELRVERGRANIIVDHPADNTLLLVDLPGGQTDLLKDGLYTFNAETNTVRVIHGEATAYSAAAATKGVKVKEYQSVTFSGPALHAVNFSPESAGNDVLPATYASRGESSPRGEGFVGEPYAYGYAPYVYGYPYGYGYYGDPYFGYPFGLGLGFGYYGGGFGYGGYYGGYRGGFGGGFRGGFGRR